MTAAPPPTSSELRELALIVARALLMIIHYLDRRYQLGLRTAARYADPERER